MKTTTLAAIDIGSNAIRLLISTVDDASKEFNKTAFLRVPIRLGEDVFTKGKISNTKKKLLCDAMTGFIYLMKAYKVSEYRACATSAMRDARNGEEIVDFVREKIGIEIEIINGREEADIIYEASDWTGIIEANRSYLYVDVGGGSTEIVVYGHRHKESSQSFQIGTVRMLVDAVSKKEIERLKNWLKQIYKSYSPLTIIASGGNINKIHKLLGKRERENIKYPELKVLQDTISGMDFNERMINYKLNDYRADVIVPAMNIFTTICEECKVNDIYVPKVGLVDGIVHRLYYKSVTVQK